MIENGSKYIFDEQDANLFLLEDKDLKARAIRCSIIPRLLELANAAIAEAAELYGVEPLEIATVAYSPYTGESRGNGFKSDFNFALAGLAPVRKKGAYPLFGNDRMIFIEGLSFRLRRESVQIVFHVDCHNESCREKLFEFFRRHETEIMPFVIAVGGEAFISGPNPPMINLFPCSLNEKVFKAAKRCNAVILSYPFDYPIEERAAAALKRAFVILYPVFHAICLLAMGRENEFDLAKATASAITYQQKCFERRKLSAPKGDDKATISTLDKDEVEKIADGRIRVMPGKRWQVFERDGWRCAACGKSAEDGAILEVDHILPRSKGGSDDIANLQTLCRECNIGKSNKNRTDLRRKR